MRSTRLIAFGLVASMVAAPLAAHAATYKKYTSKVCKYSVEYPAGWLTRSASNRGTGADVFVDARTVTKVPTNVTIVCARLQKGTTNAALTRQVEGRLRAQGATIKSVHSSRLGSVIGGEFAHFQGAYGKAAALVETTVSVLHGVGWEVQVVSSPAAWQHGALPIYVHMIATFHPR